jgi:hypothetical protein
VDLGPSATRQAAEFSHGIDNIVQVHCQVIRQLESACVKRREGAVVVVVSPLPSTLGESAVSRLATLILTFGTYRVYCIIEDALLRTFLSTIKKILILHMV